jgi:hypothetical protein
VASGSLANSGVLFRGAGKAVPTAWSVFVVEGEQVGLCELISAGQPRKFEYRAKAHFKAGFHVSVLREIRSVSQTNSAARPGGELKPEMTACRQRKGPIQTGCSIWTFLADKNIGANVQ